MNTGKSNFAQLMAYLPMYQFRGCVNRYRGNHKVWSFSCWDQFLCMAFAQLTHRESLRNPAAAGLDLRGNIPSFVRITHGTVHDVNVLDDLIPEPGSFYIMDPGYFDFGRLSALGLNGAFFVTRSKSNFQFRRIYSHPIDKSTALKCDQTIVLTVMLQLEIE